MSRTNRLGGSGLPCRGQGAPQCALAGMVRAARAAVNRQRRRGPGGDRRGAVPYAPCRHDRPDRATLPPAVLGVLYAVLGGGRPRGASLETAPTNGHQGVSVRRLPPRGDRRAPGGGGGGSGGT